MNWIGMLTEQELATCTAMKLDVVSFAKRKAKRNMMSLGSTAVDADEAIVKLDAHEPGKKRCPGCAHGYQRPSCKAGPGGCGGDCQKASLPAGTRIAKHVITTYIGKEGK